MFAIGIADHGYNIKSRTNKRPFAVTFLWFKPVLDSRLCHAKTGRNVGYFSGFSASLSESATGSIARAVLRSSSKSSSTQPSGLASAKSHLGREAFRHGHDLYRRYATINAYFVIRRGNLGLSRSR